MISYPIIFLDKVKEIMLIDKWADMEFYIKKNLTKKIKGMWQDGRYSHITILAVTLDEFG